MSQEFFNAEQFVRDVQSAMADMGKTLLHVNTLDDAGQEVLCPVDCMARVHGHERLSDGAEAFSNERARLATVFVLTSDIETALGSSSAALQRGDAVTLFDEEWQVRSVRSMGFATGQVLRLTLAADENTRGKSRG